MINEVKSIADISARMTAYKQLNFDEKFTIWKEHLEGWKHNVTLTFTQIAIIEEVLSNIKPEMWKDNNSKTIVRNSENIAIVQYKIKKYFSQQLGSQIFSTITDNFNSPIESFIYDDGHYRCQCNVGSWFNSCSSQYPSCGGATVCSQHGTYECGFMGWYQCNGDCFYIAS